MSIDPQTLTQIEQWSATFLGVVCTHFYVLGHKPASTHAAWRRYLPGRSDLTYDRLDLIFNLIVGTIVGHLVYTPTSLLQALAAGITYSAALNLKPMKPIKPKALPRRSRGR